MNLIRLRPRQRGRIHRHERQEEVYVVLEGTLTLEVEGEPHELPARQRAASRPTCAAGSPTAPARRSRVLAIGGAEPHEGRDGVAFASWDDETGASPQEIPLPADLERR